eukprot:gene23259-biopygen19321
MAPLKDGIPILGTQRACIAGQPVFIAGQAWSSTSLERSESDLSKDALRHAPTPPPPPPRTSAPDPPPADPFHRVRNSDDTPPGLVEWVDPKKECGAVRQVSKKEMEPAPRGQCDVVPSGRSPKKEPAPRGQCDGGSQQKRYAHVSRSGGTGTAVQQR